MNSFQPPTTALIVNDSALKNDPRVLRQIEWLAASGWTIDTLGLGPTPPDGVRVHYTLRPFTGVRNSRVFRTLVHALLPNRLRFRLLDGWRVPHTLRQRVPRDRYNLVVMNDIELLPWIRYSVRNLLDGPSGGACHLDLHEYHEWSPKNRVERILRRRLAGYHAWLKSHIRLAIFTSRSTVAPGIAELYATEFSIPLPSIVRNSTPFVSQEPSPVDPMEINLVYHGNADPDRGLHLLVEAMRLLDTRFVLNLMLTGSSDDRSWLANFARDLGDRVRFVAPVPMPEVPSAINRFDLEIIFFPPTTNNLRYVLPNKFFEAVQGRLGLVIGESVDMVALVTQFDNGLVVNGWRPEDLAAAIESLDGAKTEKMKSGSHAAARYLCSEREKISFLHALGFSNPTEG